MRIDQAFPERQAMPPQLNTGAPQIQPPVGSLLAGLRRQQLLDLASAFDVAVSRDGTLQQLLPPLLQAEQEGVFQREALRPAYLKRATRTPDDPPLPAMEQAGMENEIEVAKHVSPQTRVAGRS